MIQSLDLSGLMMVRLIVQEGSLSKAAEQMYRSQSAVSHKLKEMESQLGFPLFERRSRRMLLTERGQIIFLYAVKIHEQLEAMGKALEDARIGRVERIRLVTACYTSYHWLPAVIRKFKSDHPGVAIEMRTNPDRNPLAQLQAGEIDIAISDTRVGGSAQLRSDMLFEDEFLLLASRHSRYAGMKQISRDDLHGADLVMFDVPDVMSTALNAFVKPLGIQLNSITRMPTTEGIMELVAADMGVTLIPSWVAAPYLQRRQVIQLNVPGKKIKRKWYAFSRKQSTRHQKELIRIFQSELKAS
ncbi:MAG TPA: LysR family transcriptional regulator [Chryseolinea sp.]